MITQGARPDEPSPASADLSDETSGDVDQRRTGSGPTPEGEERGPAGSGGTTWAVAPALSVAGAARGLGVATATLRSWERRYGLAPSLHTPGGHRRYGPEDLARLRVMHRLVREGVPPSEAARVAIRSPVGDLHDASAPYGALLGVAAAQEPPRPEAGQREERDAGQALGAGEQPAGPSTPATLPSEAHPPPPAPPGGGRVLAMPRGTANARGLARAAMALDAVSCRRALVASLAERGAVVTWDELVRPVMAAIGERWESTGRGIEVEHSFSLVVTGVLIAHSARLARPRNDRPVLLASVPAELHDLPLLALQAALADLEIRCHVVGARTPHEALIDAVVRLGPPVVFLWAQLPTSWEPVLPALRPQPVLVLGGPGWTLRGTRPEGPGDLAGAVAIVRAAMGL